MTDSAFESPLLDNKEAAQMLRIDVKELKRLVDNGEIPYLTFGSGKKNPRRKYLIEDLNRFIQSRRKVSCPSTSTRNRKSGTTTSKCEVIDFMDRLV